MNKPHNTPHILRGSLKGERLRMRAMLLQEGMSVANRTNPHPGDLNSNHPATLRASKDEMGTREYDANS